MFTIILLKVTEPCFSFGYIIHVATYCLLTISTWTLDGQGQISRTSM